MSESAFRPSAEAATPTGVSAFTMYMAIGIVYQLQEFERAHCNKSDRGYYPPGFFFGKHRLKGIKAESRKVIDRLARLHECIVCSTPLSQNSTGDHVVALAKGGRNSLENFIPLCRNHNSSKGSKDLIEWAVDKGYIDRFTPDVLCVYAREMYITLRRKGELEEAADPCFFNAVREIAVALLPEYDFGVYWETLVRSVSFLSEVSL